MVKVTLELKENHKINLLENCSYANNTPRDHLEVKTLLLDKDPYTVSVLIKPIPKL